MAETEASTTKPGAPSAEAKEKFRQALEAKKARSHRTSDGASSDGAVQGSETTGPVQTQFRRKTGAS
ncbi:MAG: DUF5302 domain-containing protein [Micrococcales bacterium]|nr:DUF5302 domain-containing protein [Micrococcales bacterium]MCL2668474.1 DUF5302 domain-containing protein [Micrococcales bacterium]